MNTGMQNYSNMQAMIKSMGDCAKNAKSLGFHHQMKVADVSYEVKANFTNETIKYTMKNLDECQITNDPVKSKGEIEPEEKIIFLFQK
jgi:phage host-nuclease inhibitor protein Gam